MARSAELLKTIERAGLVAPMPDEREMGRKRA
jgi:hypothetical protein